MSEIKPDNQITVHAALENISKIRQNAPLGVQAIRNLYAGIRDGNTAPDNMQLVHKINEYVATLPRDVQDAVSFYIGADSRVHYGSTADILVGADAFQWALNHAAKLNDKDDKLLFYNLVLESEGRGLVMDADVRGQVWLNVVRLEKTPTAYSKLFNSVRRGESTLSNDQVKEILQEYYDVKKQEIVAEFDKTMPDMDKIKAAMWNRWELAQLTNDTDTQNMAYALGDDLAQMAEKATKMQTREEFTHDAIEIPLLEKEQQNAELTSQNKQLNTQVDQLRAQIAQMSREIEKLNDQVATVTTERDTARNENSTLKMRLAKLKMLFKDFSKNFSGLSKTSTIQDKADAVLDQFERDGR